MRSRLWEPGARVERSVLPSMGRMIADQTGVAGGGDETQEQMRQRYQEDL
jgi:hypothetical protein